MVGHRKKRKIRVTKKEVQEWREEKKKNKADKKKIIPGPWTNMETDIKVKTKLRKSIGLVESMGDAFGNYLKDQSWWEPGWYPLVFNIQSTKMKKEVYEYGIDQYLAASEIALNNVLVDGKKKYGTIVLLKATIDHSQHEDPEHRFISCVAKTNKKSIVGFRAFRKGIFKTL